MDRRALFEPTCTGMHRCPEQNQAQLKGLELETGNAETVRLRVNKPPTWPYLRVIRPIRSDESRSNHSGKIVSHPYFFLLIIECIPKKIKNYYNKEFLFIILGENV